MTDAPIPSETEATRLVTASTRLRAFVRKHAPGGCRLASQGTSCHCPLCDIDELAAAALKREGA
jgi:hypothetical protein